MPPIEAFCFVGIFGHKVAIHTVHFADCLIIIERVINRSVNLFVVSICTCSHCRIWPTLPLCERHQSKKFCNLLPSGARYDHVTVENASRLEAPSKTLV